MNWLRRVFRRENPTTIQSNFEFGPNEAFLYEDFYCQVELLPIECLKNLEVENIRIDEFSKNNFDGIGFTDVYCRDEQKSKTSDRKIDVLEFETFVQSLGFTKMDGVFGIDGSEKIVCQNTSAFSLDKAIVFCDYENGLIENIWIDGFRFKNESEYVIQMTDGLSKIGSKWNLILNDWDLTQTIILTDKSEVEKYIREM